MILRGGFRKKTNITIKFTWQRSFIQFSPNAQLVHLMQPVKQKCLNVDELTGNFKRQIASRIKKKLILFFIQSNLLFFSPLIYIFFCRLQLAWFNILCILSSAFCIVIVSSPMFVCLFVYLFVFTLVCKGCCLQAMAYLTASCSRSCIVHS